MKCKSALKLFLFQAIVVFFAKVNADPTFSRSSYFTTRENKQLKGYVVKRFDSPSLLSCGQQCMRNAWCTFTNYKMSSKKDGKLKELVNWTSTTPPSSSCCSERSHFFNAPEGKQNFMNKIKISSFHFFIVLTKTIQLNHTNHDSDLNELKIEATKKSKLKLSENGALS